jgi:cytoskeletal protein CcmA (bactofilin family)
MFRSDKKPITKASASESTSNQTPLQSWQQPVPPIEEVRPLSPAPVRPIEQPRAIGERDAMARDIKDGVLNGFVGNGTVMAGEAIFKGMLRVDGNLTGHVTSEDGTLLVGANGQVDANVDVCIATVHGTVNGDIIASKRIELGRSAKVVGNIQTPALVIEQGAILEGSCRMLMKSDEKPKETSHSLVRSSTDLSDVSDVSDVSEIAS